MRGAAPHLKMAAALGDRKRGTGLRWRGQGPRRRAGRCQERGHSTVWAGSSGKRPYGGGRPGVTLGDAPGGKRPDWVGDQAGEGPWDAAQPSGVSTRRRWKGSRAPLGRVGDSRVSTRSRGRPRPQPGHRASLAQAGQRAPRPAQARQPALFRTPHRDSPVPTTGSRQRGAAPLGWALHSGRCWHSQDSVRRAPPAEAQRGERGATAENSLVSDGAHSETPTLPASFTEFWFLREG